MTIHLADESSSNPYNAEDLSNFIRTTLDDGKAQDVVVINLHGKTDIADYMVVASGSSTRHASALGSQVMDALKKHYHLHINPEGIGDGSWVLLDAGDVIVHIFKPETRALYNLEKMWSAPMFNKTASVS